MDVSGDIELSIVLPCLDEAETIAACISKATRFLREHEVRGEVVVADNGSTDRSPDIARELGATVIHVEERGYGSAVMGGIRAARGRFVIMADSDDSYDLLDLMPFLGALRAGNQLVMGNRFRGGIAPGAMPPLHRYFGTPILTLMTRLFFSNRTGDSQCGIRGFDRGSILGLDLRTTGMEFASEMLVKANLARLRIAEVPTRLAKDGRSRAPHLRTWRDGWRHLRFYLLYSPTWLFLYPGLAMVAIGTAMTIWLLPGPISFGRVRLDVHTLLYSVFLIQLGIQSVTFSLFAKVFATAEGLLPEDTRLTRIVKRVRLEVGLILGAALSIAGVAGSIDALLVWDRARFGDLDPTQVLRIVIPSVTSLVLGAQVILSSFFLSILGLRRGK